MGQKLGKQTEKPRPHSTPKNIKILLDAFLIALRVTRPQREKLARLGGSAWVRRSIDDAAEK